MHYFNNVSLHYQNQTNNQKKKSLTMNTPATVIKIKKKFQSSIYLETFQDGELISTICIAQFVSTGDCYICYKALTQSSHNMINMRYRIEHK